MEQISKLAGQQSGGSSVVKAPSAKRLAAQSKAQIGMMLDKMAAMWPAQEQHPDTAAMYQLAMEELTLEFGLVQVEQALRWFLTRTKWFPHPAEVREELEAMAKRKKQEEAARREPLGPCEICHGARIVIRDKAGNTWHDYGQGERIAHWCECVLARRKREQIAAAEQIQMAGTR